MGSAWSNKPAKVEYLLNTTASPLNCIRYSVSSADALVNNGNYAKGTLCVTKATDEDGKVQYTFTDKQGQKLLERAVNGSKYLDTYYVYDDYGCLRFVLQPMYQTTASLDLYAFQYKYDDHNNCIWKKLPGTEHVIYEYDNADRMIFSQDGNQRASGKWTFYVYDSLGRLTQQGENTSKAIAASGVYLQNYYDNYISLRSAVGSNSNYPDDTSGNSRGFLTGTMTKVLGTDTKLYTALYYDIEGRVTKKVQQNLLGGHDITTTTYSFSGKPLTVAHEHKDDDDNILLEEIVTYTYDEKDRVSTVKHKLDNTEVTLASYTYDTLGRMATKKLHGSATNRLTYSYNIQNWLTGISSTKFTQALTYNNGTTGYYNGNISSMNWNANGASHSYTFTYDGVNRMLNATHGTGAYTEKVTAYDKNGNIKALQRYGNGLIDDLTYTYSGNQLTKVEDATGSSAGFSNGASTTNEYVYDNNGNLTKDSNKGITNIAYNCLNLPSTVTFSDGSTIVYSYAADGTKLRTVHTISGTTTQKDYCANVVYENGVQKLLLTEEGYVDLSNSSYYYYLKDHQGNNRMVVNSSGTVMETNHYYPFGSTFASSSVQPYKYNGKELDTKNGLNWYDYGARHYDAALGRWFAADPLSEKYYADSPYIYCGSNPVNRIDLFGMDYWSTSNPDEISRFWSWMSQSDGNGIGSYSFITDSWNRMTDKEFLEAYERYGQQALTYNDQTNKLYSSYVTYENGEIVVNGVSTPALEDKSNINYAKFEGGEHLIGPMLIGLGQPIKALKPIGALGSKPGSSIASFTLSKIFPQKFTEVLGDKAGRKVARYATSNTIGRALGRFVPGLGWILFGYDAITTSWELGEKYGPINNYFKKKEKYKSVLLNED